MKIGNFFKKIFIIITAFIITAVSVSCENENTQATLFLGRFLQLNIYSSSARNVKACENEIKIFLKGFEEKISVNIDTSELSLFNNAKKNEEITLSYHVFNVFKQALLVYEITDGAYNPCLYGLTLLWGFDVDNENFGTIPPQQDIDALLDSSAPQKIELNEERKTALKTEDGIMADFGGIAKGYALGVCREIALKHNITSGTISIAGNIYAINRYVNNGENRKYNIAVTDPRALKNDNQFFCRLNVEDSSVSVSGDYERSFTKDGVIYSHILDPKTGRPVNNGIISVVIADKNAAFADAFSTAVMVSGLEKGSLLMNQNNLSGIIITSKTVSDNVIYSYYTFGDIEIEQVFNKYNYET